MNLFSRFFNNSNIILIIFFSIIFYFFYLAPNSLSEFFLNDNNTAVYSVYARTLLDFSYEKTKFLMAEIGPDGNNIFYDTEPLKYNYYINHPPLLVWLTTLSFKFLGVEIINGRLISILSSSLFFLFFFNFINNSNQPNKVLFSSLILLISMPIYWVHGLIIEHQPLLNLLLLLTSLSILKFKTDHSKKRVVVFFIFWTSSLLTDWIAYLFLIPFSIYLIKIKKFKFLPIIFIYPFIIYLIINFYHQFMIDDLRLSKVLGIDIFLYRTGVNLIPDSQFFYSWISSLFKMSYLFIHFNFKFVISVIFLISIVFIFFNFKNIDDDFKYLFLFFFIPSSIYMLIFRLWAESHSYWSYYYIPAILIAFIIFLKNQKLIIVNIVILIISINFIVNFYQTSKYIVSNKENLLNKNTSIFLKKYKNHDYVTADNSIGYGFGFRSRWLENKKFYNIKNYKFSENKVLLIKRLGNCKKEDKSFKKLEFFNWCYKELN